MFKCPKCSEKYSTYSRLSRHATIKHQTTEQDFYKEYYNITSIPKCECGCGKELPFKGRRGYSRFLNGHNAKGKNNPMYGKTHSEEAKQNISRVRKEKFASGEYDFIDSERWSNIQKEVWSRPGYREKIAKAREDAGWRQNISDSMSDENHPFYGKKRPEHSKLMKSPEMLEKIFAKRSATDIEILMAEMLEQIGVEYHSQFFINHGKDTYSYDFKIKGAPILIEVDGDYWHGGPSTDNHVPFVNEVKEKDALKNKVAEENGYKVLRFWGSDIIEKPFWIVQQLLQQIN
jgi:very-short-patch-repair endonuclease